MSKKLYAIRLTTTEKLKNLRTIFTPWQGLKLIVNEWKSKFFTNESDPARTITDFGMKMDGTWEVVPENSEPKCGIMHITISDEPSPQTGIVIDNLV